MKFIGTIQTIWTDSVWSNVIGGLILTATLASISWIKRKWILKEMNEAFVFLNRGGNGGNAKVNGHNGIALGGRGGSAGIGIGGDGGNAEATGDNCSTCGGDGGNAGQPDGRGGRRSQSPAERLNKPTHSWPYGYGGAGANHPEYDRRLFLLTEIRKGYMEAFPNDVIFIEAGVDLVPIHWVNKRLEEMNEKWRVEINSLEGGYKMPYLDELK